MKLWGSIILWAGVLLIVIVLRPLMVPLVIAAIIAYLLNPIVKFLQRVLRLNRAWSARIVFWLFISALVMLVYVLSKIVVDRFLLIKVEFLDAVTMLREWISRPIDLAGLQINPQLIIDNLVNVIVYAVNDIPRGSMNILSDVYTSVFLGVITFVSLYYFLRDASEFNRWFSTLYPSDYKEDIIQLLKEIDSIWKAFLFVQLLIFIVLAVLMSSGTLLVIWLFRSGLLSFSPIMFLFLIVLVIAASQQVDNLWLRPQLMGKQLQLHPGVVFAALTGALVVGGFLGAFLIVPVIATIKVLGRYVYCRLMDLPPWPIESELDGTRPLA